MNRGKPPEVADGVFMLGTKWANFYLAVDGDDCLLIDAGYPAYWKGLVGALRSVGKTPAAITAVIVTHHHVDHAGAAERLRSLTGAAVFVHEDDAPMVRGERRSHVPPRFYRQAWRPSMAWYLAHTVRAGGARYRPVSRVASLSGNQTLDLPCRPRVVHTPGHTAGHCSVLFLERGVLFSGDAMVNFDYASGARRLSQHRFNDDRDAALASLDRLDDFDVGTVLFGHGEPWTVGSRKALTIVRERAAGRDP
jgi:glyoxylase-like metal-dependent hydrolase (beta-lactamase superfamily II)